MKGEKEIEGGTKAERMEKGEEKSGRRKKKEKRNENGINKTEIKDRRGKGTARNPPHPPPARSNHGNPPPPPK